jgi:hypothetical protein
MTILGEPDNAAGRNEVGRFTDSEHRRVHGRRKDFHALRRRGPAYKDDLTPPDVISGVNLFHGERTTVPHFSLNGPLDRPTKRLIGNTYGESAVSRRKSLVRPLDEFRKVVKKRGFHLNFDTPVLGRRRKNAEEYREACSE